MHHGSVPGREDDMIQQLQEAGEELQEDEIDAVLERCEQLSLKLREALQTYDTDRSALCGPGPMFIQ
jgi:Ca2+-binding EF-hand superfamily protein